MEQKPYEVLAQELANTKDTLLNEVMHRQQLGMQLQNAAKQMEAFQSMAMKDLTELRTLTKAGKTKEVLAVFDRILGPEPEAPVQAK